ncbi:hypothetical protein ACP4OV_024327 [Aristida adscensionis]
MGGHCSKIRYRSRSFSYHPWRKAKAVSVVAFDHCHSAIVCTQGGGEERMRVLGFASVATVALVVVVLLASSSEVLAVGVPAALVDPAATDRRGALPPEQPRKAAGEGGDVAAASAGMDASRKPAAAAGPSSPSTVFDPDRMSKRRVRRGSDPIHNKC